MLNSKLPYCIRPAFMHTTASSRGTLFHESQHKSLLCSLQFNHCCCVVCYCEARINFLLYFKLNPRYQYGEEMLGSAPLLPSLLPVRVILQSTAKTIHYFRGLFRIHLCHFKCGWVFQSESETFSLQSLSDQVLLTFHPYRTVGFFFFFKEFTRKTSIKLFLPFQEQRIQSNKFSQSTYKYEHFHNVFHKVCLVTKGIV